MLQIYKQYADDGMTATRLYLALQMLALAALMSFCALSITAQAAGADDIPQFPKADVFAMVPMRDGKKMETHVLLPDGEGPFPALLVRTPYRDGVSVWGAYAHQRFLDAGYAVVWQNIRGIGKSEGTFRYVANDRRDGFDTIEWLAAQRWCDGNVGMFGGSYLGMTQMSAAAAAPPHLKAIVPSVIVSDLFRELPRMGGIFMRHHMLSWLKLVSVNSRAELDRGFVNPRFVLSDPTWFNRLTSRPLIDAADGYFGGDFLAEWRAVVAQAEDGTPFWNARSNGPEHYAKMKVPVLLLSGKFDPNVGTLSAWKDLERHAPDSAQHTMLIGPWTHRQSFHGGVTKNPPYEWGEAESVDPVGLRIAFFDQYLKGKPPAAALPQRVKVFVTGANKWHSADTIPVPERSEIQFSLASNGKANTSYSDGALTRSESSGLTDTIITDPRKPVVVETSLATGVTQYQDIEKRDDVLIYTSEPLTESMTIIGEPTINLQVSASTPDADVIVKLTEVYPDGRSIALGFGGQLRLRYRDGFDQQKLLETGEIYQVTIPMAYVSHQVASGNRIRVTIMGTEFPLLDPNPNTGEVVATATRMQKAKLSVHHDLEYPSYIIIPSVDL